MFSFPSRSGAGRVKASGIKACGRVYRPMSALAFLTDVAVVSSDLITGKSVPVLVGIARLPIDQFLACTVLTLGALAGAFFSFYSSGHTQGMHPLGHLNRLAQMLFSLFLSLSLHLALSRGVHYVHGVVLSLIPAFCVVSQSLPQRAMTAHVAILASLLAYLYCVNAPVPAAADDPFPGDEGGGLLSVLQGLNEAEDRASGVWDVLLRALLLFVLAFYACVQHAPTQVYCSDGEDVCAVYASHAHTQSRHYSLFVGLVSALLRVSVWYWVCLRQNNTLHVMLENDLSRGNWDWASYALYSGVLLFSACWTATQVREQVLPLLTVFPSASATGRLRLLVCVLALAALYRQRDVHLSFYLTAGLAACSVVVTGLTLKDW